MSADTLCLAPSSLLVTVCVGLYLPPAPMFNCLGSGNVYQEEGSGF